MANDKYAKDEYPEQTLETEELALKDMEPVQEQMDPKMMREISAENKMTRCGLQGTWRKK